MTYHILAENSNLNMIRLLFLNSHCQGSKTMLNDTVILFPISRLRKLHETNETISSKKTMTERGGREKSE